VPVSGEVLGDDVARAGARPVVASRSSSPPGKGMPREGGRSHGGDEGERDPLTSDRSTPVHPQSNAGPKLGSFFSINLLQPTATNLAQARKKVYGNFKYKYTKSNEYISEKKSKWGV
jgi:hypothetical protein